MATALLWTVAAPVYAQGLVRLGRVLSPLLEAEGTTYTVDGTRVLVQRQAWLPRQKRLAPLTWPVWLGAANYGPPLLTALILAAPGWTWRRRLRALGVGLALLTLTQVVFFVITIVATQQSPVMSPEGMIQPEGFSPIKAKIFYGLYYFFDAMGRGFFALAIFLGLIAFGWPTERVRPAAGRGARGKAVTTAGRPAGRGRRGR